MNQLTPTQDVVGQRPSVTLLMLFGLATAMAAGAASAASPSESDVPALTVRFSADALDTDHGAKILYNRLVQAAEQVCPSELTGSHLVSGPVLHCRQEAVARAVHQINNSRLAAVYSATTKRG